MSKRVQWMLEPTLAGIQVNTDSYIPSQMPSPPLSANQRSLQIQIQQQQNPQQQQQVSSQTQHETVQPADALASHSGEATRKPPLPFAFLVAPPPPPDAADAARGELPISFAAYDANWFDCYSGGGADFDARALDAAGLMAQFNLDSSGLGLGLAFPLADSATSTTPFFFPDSYLWGEILDQQEEQHAGMHSMLFSDRVDAVHISSIDTMSPLRVPRQQQQQQLQHLNQQNANDFLLLQQAQSNLTSNPEQQHVNQQQQYPSSSSLALFSPDTHEFSSVPMYNSKDTVDETTETEDDFCLLPSATSSQYGDDAASSYSPVVTMQKRKKSKIASLRNDDRDAQDFQESPRINISRRLSLRLGKQSRQPVGKSPLSCYQDSGGGGGGVSASSLHDGGSASATAAIMNTVSEVDDSESAFFDGLVSRLSPVVADQVRDGTAKAATPQSRHRNIFRSSSQFSDSFAISQQQQQQQPAIFKEHSLFPQTSLLLGTPTTPMLLPPFAPSLPVSLQKSRQQRKRGRRGDDSDSEEYTLTSPILKTNDNNTTSSTTNAAATKAAFFRQFPFPSASVAAAAAATTAIPKSCTTDIDSTSSLLSNTLATPNLACKCGRGPFSSYYSLRAHMKSIRHREELRLRDGEKDDDNEDDVVERGKEKVQQRQPASQQQQLQQLQQQQQEQRRFPCDDCGKTFARRRDWKRHVLGGHTSSRSVNARSSFVGGASDDGRERGESSGSGSGGRYRNTVVTRYLNTADDDGEDFVGEDKSAAISLKDLQCKGCGNFFSRSDALRRHVKNKICRR
ncbi:hypothetical protein BDR26DRAFT_869804 [Obelidium mucronatum]|nr:hypothetical protein BDR26DRAFT_869804 [Obelidium mucronatum]